MSADSNIYFLDSKFPIDAWEEVLRHFGAECRGETKWVIDLEDGTIWLDLKEILPSNIGKESFSWKVGIHYRSPYTAKKLWATLSIPYHCATLMSNVVYFDPSGEFEFKDPDEIEEFAYSYLVKRTSVEKLDKLGLLDLNEKVKLASSYKLGDI